MLMFGKATVSSSGMSNRVLNRLTLLSSSVRSATENVAYQVNPPTAPARAGSRTDGAGPGMCVGGRDAVEGSDPTLAHRCRSSYGLADEGRLSGRRRDRSRGDAGGGARARGPSALAANLRPVRDGEVDVFDVLPRTR